MATEIDRRQVERWTVHVDTRWTEAERVPILEIVDRAFRRYFERR
jgi:hypothetical protein